MGGPMAFPNGSGCYWDAIGIRQPRMYKGLKGGKVVVYENGPVAHMPHCFNAPQKPWEFREVSRTPGLGFRSNTLSLRNVFDLHSPRRV